MEMRAAAGQQPGPQCSIPPPHKTLNATDSYGKILEVDLSSAEPPSDYGPGQHPDYSLMRDPEPEDPAKPCLDSWPTKAAS